MKQDNQGKITDLSIAAFVLSFFGFTSLIGAILGMVDVSQKDGRSKGLSIAAITVGVILTIIICVLAFGLRSCKEEEEVRPPVIRDYSLPNAPVYGPEITPSPSPTEIPEVVTL